MCMYECHLRKRCKDVRRKDVPGWVFFSVQQVKLTFWAQANGRSHDLIRCEGHWKYFCCHGRGRHQNRSRPGPAAPVWQSEGPGAECRFSRPVWQLPEEQVRDWGAGDPVTHTPATIYSLLTQVISHITNTRLTALYTCMWRCCCKHLPWYYLLQKDILFLWLHLFFEL